MNFRAPILAVIAACLAACASGPANEPPTVSAADARAMIGNALPERIKDRDGWVNDIYSAFSLLTITPTHENICAVTSVIAQESSFQVDPVVPNLGPMAWKEIDTRADHAHVPHSLVRGVLSLKSASGKTYAERIDAARTEKQL